MNCFREHWLVADKTSFLIGLVFDSTKGPIVFLYHTAAKKFLKQSRTRRQLSELTLLIHQSQALGARERDDSIPDTSLFLGWVSG